MSFLVLEALTKRYGTSVALDRVSLEIAAGSRTAIVGPSGSGKSTLLRLIAGFEAPDSGRIEMAGETLADGHRFLPAHKRGIGIVAQDGALFPHLSVAENIGFGLDASMPDRDARIADLLAMVDLDRTLLGRRPHQLSGGQQQRVALARALARQPRLMLLDEPFSALDTGLREAMRHAVARVLDAAGITTILVTHDQAEALSFADQVAVMRQGQLVQAGKPQDVYFRPCDEETARFLGDAIVISADADGLMATTPLGSVSIDSSRIGPVDLLLRPEQIVLADAGADGHIISADFAGALTSLSIALSACPGVIIMLKVASQSAPDVGTRVTLAVTGVAHAF
jgi:iron(III) transport system ATP-binding protein